MRNPADFEQMTPVTDVRHGANFSLARLGSAGSWDRYGVRHPLTGDVIPGKVFLKAPLGLTGTEISFGVVPAGASVPFLHKHHANEEVYLIIGGRGQIQVDGETFDVAEGDAVRIDPDGVRAWRAAATEELRYVVIQSKAGSLTRWTSTDGIGVPGGPVWPD